MNNLYISTNGLCSFDISTLEDFFSREEIFEALKEKKFEIVEVDIISLARECVGKSVFKKNSRVEWAPGVVDCSSFVKWLYSMRGIRIPRRPIQQSVFGVAVEELDIRVGDLVFKSGARDLYWDDPKFGVGHVGIVTEKRSVIHASIGGVVEVPFSEFSSAQHYRGARRIVRDKDILTLKIPFGRSIETSDDIMWILLRTIREKVREKVTV